MKKYLSSVLAIMLVAIICNVSWAGPTGPEEEKEFRTCSQSMDITDVRFSAGAEVGVSVVFDDIGCAVVWRNIQCALDQRTFDKVATARDFNDLSTIVMSESFFVLDDRLITPIGFGIAAFKDKGSAKKFISVNGSGRLLSYKELIKLELRPPEPPEEEDKGPGKP